MEHKKGDIIEFGMYQQQTNSKATPIEWYIIDMTDDKICLLSKYVVEIMGFQGNNWSQSNIRRWLNNVFYEAAFSDDEKQKICETVLLNNIGLTIYNLGEGDFEFFYTPLASDVTRDKVFIPEINDLCKKITITKNGRVQSTREEYDETIKQIISTTEAIPALYMFQDIPFVHTNLRSNKVAWHIRNMNCRSHIDKGIVCDGNVTCCYNRHNEIIFVETRNSKYGIRPMLWRMI